ncbi:MAG: 16S rRNA (guanine(527)-N(7))-methyltransferase RsmG [Rhodobacteraceae bacterium]|nr:16S rRNA (guanine(527)-N(7))-methyltransferase RsmG [Paracoccaceae bacterium]
MARLARYEELLYKWNPAINLVAKSTLSDIWDRHFQDSALAFRVADRQRWRWADLGSGGGFPGAVAAILAVEKAPELSVACIESDTRKSEFIRTVARETGVAIKVVTQRIELSPLQNADVVSARALAPLPQLLEHVSRHLAPGGVAVLHKGERHAEEMETALETWAFTVEKHVSPTNPNSVLLKIGDLSRG